MIDEIKGRQYLDRAAVALVKSMENPKTTPKVRAELANALAMLIQVATYQAEAAINAKREY